MTIYETTNGLIFLDHVRTVALDRDRMLIELRYDGSHTTVLRPRKPEELDSVYAALKAALRAMADFINDKDGGS